MAFEIEDATFRRAVELLDAGDEAGLRAHLEAHPGLVRQRLSFAGNYFRNPTLLEFTAENPIRNEKLPKNIVEIARIILEAGAKDDQAALDEAIGLVSSGRVARECGVQIGLIDLLCDYGADAEKGVLPSLVHGEFEAARALLRRGASLDISVAAAFGMTEEVRRLFGDSDEGGRHRALALAAQFGHKEIVELLLDAGEDPSRYNPPSCHGHSTPLHQAALAGHEGVVHLLVERGARLDTADRVWRGTPAGWAEHGGQTDIADYLKAREQTVKLEASPSVDNQ